MSDPNKWAFASAAKTQASAEGYARFKRDQLGISVHFGLYSIDGRKEWNQNLDKIDRDVYAARVSCPLKMSPIPAVGFQA